MHAENHEILCEICKITGRPHSDIAVEGLRDEWKHVAQVWDRFFFVVFCVVQLSLFFITFGIMD